MLKPSIIDISRWEKEFYGIRMPTMTKQEYVNKRKKDWYREQYYKKNS